jgi:hypothetical protein
MTYKEYLETAHMELNPTVLDDDLPDSFEAWVSNLDSEETARYITDYIGKRLLDETPEKMIEILKDINAFYF